MILLILKIYITLWESEGNNKTGVKPETTYKFTVVRFSYKELNKAQEPEANGYKPYYFRNLMKDLNNHEHTVVETEVTSEWRDEIFIDRQKSREFSFKFVERVCV